MSNVDMENFEERLLSLQTELQRCGEEIMNNIGSLYTSKEAMVDLKNDPRLALKILKHDVVELLKASKTKSEYLEKHRTEINECEKMMTIISAVSSAADAIMKADDMNNTSDLNNTCKAISEIEKTLLNLPNTSTEFGSGGVCNSLRREGRLVKFRFQARLKRLFASCIRVEIGHIIIQHQLKGLIRNENIIVDDPITLTEILEAMHAVGGFTDVISSTLTSIWRNLMSLLWKEKKVTVPKVSITSENSEIYFESIAKNNISNECNVADDSSVGACRLPFPHLLEQLGVILTFIWTEILNGNDKYSEAYCSILSSDPINLLTTLQNTLLLLLPKTALELSSLRKNIEKPCKEFEAKLTNIGLSSLISSGTSTSTSSGDRPNNNSINFSIKTNEINANNSTEAAAATGALTVLVSELPNKFSEIRRREILARCRQLLLADYHNCMFATGDAREDNPSSAGDIGSLSHGDSGNAHSSSSGGGGGGGSGSQSGSLLSTSVSDTTSYSMSASALRFEPCLVSLASCRLLRLVHEVLEQSLSNISSASFSNILYQTARDCFELFLAIIPLRFSDVLENVPRMAALFYNDCVYVAHNCTLLTYTYLQRLNQMNATQSSCAGFIDFIPRFRMAGEKCLAKHLEDQKNTFLELFLKININTVEENNEYANSSLPSVRLLRSRVIPSNVNPGGNTAVNATSQTHAAATSCNNEEAVMGIVKHFEKLRGQWEEVLQENVYERIFGYLLETVLRAVMSPILQSDCISELAATHLSKIMKILQNIKSVIMSTSHTKNESDDADDTKINSITASWKKYKVLTELLEFNLLDISEGLSRRKFATFTSTELIGLIKALFEDSPRRQNILNTIMEMAS